MGKKLVRFRVDLFRDPVRVYGLAQTQRGTTYLDRSIALDSKFVEGKDRKQTMKSAIEAVISGDSSTLS